MTITAVGDLLESAGLPDTVGWITRNISAALLLASVSIDSWEGLEWAVESGPDDEPLRWAGPHGLRIPYAYLRGRGPEADAVVGIYQDDGAFGLRFVPTGQSPELPASDVGSLRSHRGIKLACGPIRQVEVAYDTSVQDNACTGVLTEVLLHGETQSTLLVAAEAYSADEWHLYDESVVALDGLAAADSLEWIPARPRWTSTTAGQK